MTYEIISAADFDHLPDNPGMKFVELDRICRRNMLATISQGESGHLNTMVRLQYMTTMAAVATELAIPDVVFPHGEEYPSDSIDMFMLAVSAAVIRIRLRSKSPIRN